VLVATTTTPKIEVFRYNPATKGRDLVIDSLKPLDTKDTVALQTYKAAQDTLKYYKDTFNRNSFDNKGATVNVVIGYEEVAGTPLNNAYWDQHDKTMYFGNGDGTMFTPLGAAPDVFAHEFTHAVINSEVRLDYVGQEGGIQESYADILATGVDNNTQIGESVFTPSIPGDAIRDLPNLRYNHVKFLPTGEGEPHTMGEPLSTAAMRAADTIGIDKVRHIWYDSVIKGLKNHSGFDGARDATIKSAKLLYGETTSLSVQQAWDAVGILGTNVKKEAKIK